MANNIKISQIISCLNLHFILQFILLHRHHQPDNFPTFLLKQALRSLYKVSRLNRLKIWNVKFRQEKATHCFLNEESDFHWARCCLKPGPPWKHWDPTVCGLQHHPYPGEPPLWVHNHCKMTKREQWTKAWNDHYLTTMLRQ